ncbi:hypothetical protein C1645_773427 [Glomus cerebriforme]|uniref:Uncharacterized protein n=1 Tax=Glomus cerebriforme TaxID=658196 RepID=A0A397SSB2_9GLOM|nr:hypothetical protein C1645_773427 [Glomus cerebriforme]
MTKRGFYLFLRIIQLLNLLCIIGLEITQLILFKIYNDMKQLDYTTSWKGWFESFKQHGIKYFYYVVIIITLLYILYNLITFVRRWKTGPHQSVIFIEMYVLYIRTFKFLCTSHIKLNFISIYSFFLLLWLAIGFTSIYPIYFDNPNLDCNLIEEFRNLPSRLTECHTYLASMGLGWFMAFLFLLTTIHSVYLWSQRDNIRYQIAQNEKDKDVPYPNPDNPVV